MRHAATVCMLEQLCDSWFELVLHLRELESVAGDLEVLLPFRRVRFRDVGIFFGLFEMDRDRCIHSPYQHATAVGTENQRHTPRPPEVLQ
jgi:hypothetical protein